MVSDRRKKRKGNRNREERGMEAHSPLDPWGGEAVACSSHSDCYIVDRFKEAAGVVLCEDTIELGKVCMCNKWNVAIGKECDVSDPAGIAVIFAYGFVLIAEIIFFAWSSSAFYKVYVKAVTTKDIDYLQKRSIQSSHSLDSAPPKLNAAIGTCSSRNYSASNLRGNDGKRLTIGDYTCLTAWFSLLFGILHSCLKLWSAINPGLPAGVYMLRALPIAVCNSSLLVAMIMLTLTWNHMLKVSNCKPIVSARTALLLKLYGALSSLAMLYFLVVQNDMMASTLAIAGMFNIVVVYNIVVQKLLKMMASSLANGSTGRAVLIIQKQTRTLTFGVLIVLILVSALIPVARLDHPKTSAGMNLVFALGLHPVFVVSFVFALQSSSYN